MYFDLETKDSPFIFSSARGLGPTPHLHAHLELVYLRDGSSMCHADGKECLARGGDVFVAFPNQIHYYLDIERPQHDIIIFSADFCPDLAKTLRSLIPAVPVIERARVPASFGEQIEKIRAAQADPSPYAQAEVRAYMTLLLCSLLPLLQPEKPRAGYDGNLLKKVVAYCYENYHEDISLEHAESVLGISRFYISRLFREKLHIGFKEYINSLRIQSACEMLKNTEKSITDIAYDAGFGTPRTFNRCFIQAKGVCPREYRAKQSG